MEIAKVTNKQRAAGAFEMACARDSTMHCDTPDGLRAAGEDKVDSGDPRVSCNSRVRRWPVRTRNRNVTRPDTPREVASAR